MKSILAAGVLAAMAVALPAQAATIQVVSGDQRAFALGFFGNTVGQSFTAVDSLLSSFGFQWKTFNDTHANTAYTFTLRQGAGLTGNVIATTSFTVSTATSATVPTWVDFALAGANVTVGGIYTAVITGSNTRFGLMMGPNININTGQETSGDAYAGGRAFFTQPVYSNCAITGNCDLNFRVTGSTAVPAVPEPAAWAMMLAGFGALGFAMRRRVKQTARIRFA